MSIATLRGRGRTPTSRLRPPSNLPPVDAPPREEDPTAPTTRTRLSETPAAPLTYAPILSQSFDRLLFTDPGVSWLNGAGYPTPPQGSVAIVPDATAPRSPSGVVRWTYNAGFDSANAPGYRECVFGASYRALYTCLWLRPSVTWENHLSSVNKLFYWTTRNTPGQTGTSFISLFFNGTAAPTGLRFITQNPGAGQVLYTTSGFIPTLGEWLRIEALQERTRGIYGRVRLWCAKQSAPEPVLALDASNVALTDAAQSEVVWTGAIANPYWGGNGGVARREFTLDVDHLVMSGVAA